MRATLTVMLIGLAVSTVVGSFSLSSATPATVGIKLLQTVPGAQPRVIQKFPNKEVNAKTKDLSTPLHWATVQGDTGQVKLLLSKRADVNVKDMYGWTPLHYAVVEGHADVVAMLVSGGADIDVKDGDNVACVSRAIALGHRKIARLLLAKGADFDVKNCAGSTPLHQAAEKGYKDLVEFLLNKGADQNVTDGLVESPLHGAVRRDHRDVVKLLLTKGANINATDSSGKTSLFWAARNGKKEMVEFLIAKGAVVAVKNKEGKTPQDYAMAAGHKAVAALLQTKGAITPSTKSPTLHEAARRGQKDIMAGLLAKGAEVDAKDKNGATALYYAIRGKRLQVVELLLAQGAGINAKDTAALLEYAAIQGDSKVIELLLARGADVTAGNAYGETLLHNAARSSCRNSMKLLLDKGADVNAKDKNGATALHYAAAMGHRDIVDILLAKGADVAATDKAGGDALYYAMAEDHIKTVESLLAKGGAFKDKDAAALLRRAIKGGHAKIADSLLAKGADANAKGNDGKTLLHDAASGGHKEIAELLLAKGAEVAATDKNGATPLHCALKSGKKDVVSLLLAKGANISVKDKKGKTPLAENPKLLIQCAKSGREAYGMWRTARESGFLAKRKDFDPISRYAAAKIQNDLKNNKGDITFTELQEIWDAAEKRGAKKMALIRYAGLVNIGNYKSALVEAKKLKNLKYQINCEMKLGLRAEVIKHALAVMQKRESANVKWWVRTLNELKLSDAEFADILGQCCRFGTVAVRYTALTRMKQLALDNKSDKCLTMARIAYETWPYEDMNSVLTEVGNCLRILEMDVTRMNEFLRFQQTGPTGGLKDPLAEASRTLPESAKAALNKRLQSLIPKGNQASMYRTFVQRGEVYQLMGKHDDALREYRAAYAVAPMKKIKAASGLIPSVLKARDHHIVNANTYLEFQRFGPTGADGKIGTKDDIKDPCGKIAMKFSPAVEAALKKLAAANNPKAADKVELAGIACFALGDYKTGFNRMRVLYANAGMEKKALARAVKGIALAIKAFDGHVYRANQYLAYQTHGGKTPKGKIIKNPLPQIMKELGSGT